MADCHYGYPEMRAAADQIRDVIAKGYKTAAETFEADFTAAIQGWEGDSKDKMAKFISGTVKGYIWESIPKLLEALADLLDANVDEMTRVDEGCAENIPE